MTPTQCDRVLDYIRRHPGVSAMTLINALAIPNYRARISDLRAQGFVIEAKRDKYGLWGGAVHECRRPRQKRYADKRGNRWAIYR